MHIDDYRTVCQDPGGNGFRVEHMPDFLRSSDFDDSMPHTHNFYEIVWFKEGTGRHFVDFTEYEVKPNTIFFLSPGQVHNFDGNTDYLGLSIKLCTDFMKNEERESSLFLKYDVFHSYDSSPCCRISDSIAAELDALVKAMEDEAQRTGEFGNTDILQSLLRVFLVKVQRYGVRDEGLKLDPGKPSNVLFVKFRRLVENEFKSLRSVKEYASRLNVAERTLNKCVNECSDMSPLTFINNRVLLEAKRMVRYTDLQIKEIAFDLGFEDPSYFVKLFKRQTGCLPSEFRKLR